MPAGVSACGACENVVGSPPCTGTHQTTASATTSMVIMTWGPDGDNGVMSFDTVHSNTNIEFFPGVRTPEAVLWYQRSELGSQKVFDTRFLTNCHHHTRLFVIGGTVTAGVVVTGINDVLLNHHYQLMLTELTSAVTF